MRWDENHLEEPRPLKVCRKVMVNKKKSKDYKWEVYTQERSEHGNLTQT
jgi:hypothetical protein